MDTTKLDDLLNEAEAQEENQIEWLLDQKYDVKDFYVDEHGIVEIKNKTIGDMSKHISVKGESYSQYIEFKINRFYDGIDLTNMLLAIYYDVPNVGSDESKPINVYYNEAEIKFGWAIPVEVAQTNLTIDLCVYARGKLSDGKDYVLKTKTATYQINDGLDLGGNILKPTNNWYLNFVLEMDEKIAQANASADIATQNANKVEEIEQSISNAYEQVSTMHTEVESMRDEVERMKDQVEDLTGVGIASVDKLGVVKPDGETIDIEEDGTLKCIIEVTKDYSSLENKPKINGTELDGNKSFEDLGFKGTTDYKVLENKPSVAGIELNGDMSYDELGLVSKKDIEDNFEIVNQNIQELDEYTQSLGRDVSNFAGAIQETNLGLQTLNERVDNLNQSTTNNFTTIGQRLEEIENDLINVEDTLSSADTKIKELETDLEETSNQLQEVYTTSEENKKEVADVRKELSDTTLKVDTVIEKADLRIKETASGESIHSTISANAKVVEFGLYGKATQKTTTGAQLLNYDAWKNVGTIRGTSVFENNGITMTATDNSCYTDYPPSSSYPVDARIPVDEGDEITLSWEESSNKSGRIFAFGCNAESAINHIEINNNTAKSLTYTVPSNVTFITFRFAVENAGDTISYKNIMINKGSTTLPYEPYTGGQPSPNPGYDQDVEISGASGNVGVKNCGKNLLNHVVKSEDDFANSNSGIKVTVNPDKSITLNGKANRTLYITVADYFDKNEELWLSGLTYYNSNMSYGLFAKTNGRDNYYWDRGKGCKFNLGDNETYWICLIVFEGREINNETIYPMIRECDENGNPIGDDTYEPYKETASTIPTKNGLAGIDVDSGGNYTDSNGQQWICDKIMKYADGSGEYVQRVKEIVFDGTQKFTGAGSNFSDSLSFNYIVADKKANNEWTKIISNICPFIPSYVDYINEGKKGVGGIGTYITFKLDRSFLNNATGTNAENEEMFNNFLASKYNEGNPVKALYQLNEPIRTPLTAEQIAEIEKLSTFYPVTNISNDADCGMKVTYIVDAKKYIDNKIAELAAAMVNNI